MTTSSAWSPFHLLRRTLSYTLWCYVSMASLPFFQHSRNGFQSSPAIPSQIIDILDHTSRGSIRTSHSNYSPWRALSAAEAM
ncbi:uncharacterized protein EDB91DRAFT_1137045, partial [Suillus paluster]|uniref:uncharacterized protein n=1 Tax=Suillus paluster TaxID=48578 RepID=UPI001B86EF06